MATSKTIIVDQKISEMVSALIHRGLNSQTTLSNEEETQAKAVADFFCCIQCDAEITVEALEDGD